MIKNNLLLEKLSDKVRSYNEDVNRNLQSVAVWQNFITIMYVVFTIVVFIISDRLLVGKTIVSGINNNVISLIITIVLLLVSFPLAPVWIRKFKKKSFVLNIDNVEPEFDYSGKWEYTTVFKVKSKPDGSKEYDILDRNMNNFAEEGKSVWSQKGLDINIEHAYTDDVPKNEHSVEDPKVEWDSSPVVFAKNTIEWHFEGHIRWKGSDTMANIFSGTETYDVVERDEIGKPSVLKGTLTGTIHVGEHYYVVEADSDFNRI
jgi:hypothetical protein